MTLGTVAVTGAGGYVGSGAVRQLVDSGWSVRAIVRTPRSYIGTPDQVVVDLASTGGELRAALEGCDAVLHLAGANEAVAADDPDAALRDTIIGSRHVAAAAADIGVPRVVYVSTVHVYGAALAEGALVTEATLPAPRAVYGTARLASEHLIATEAARAGIEAVVLRLTNAVGAPVDPAVQRWTLVANELCLQAATLGKLVLRSAGVQWRDFIALSDAIALLASALDPDGLPPGTYNLGSGAPMTILDLATLVQDAVERETGTRPPLEAPPAPAVRPQPYRVDVTKLTSTGWRPHESLASAVAATARFCLQHRDAL